jgi:hypothetical protein
MTARARLPNRARVRSSTSTMAAGQQHRSARLLMLSRKMMRHDNSSHRPDERPIPRRLWVQG